MLVVIRKMHTNRIAPMVERGYREGTKFQWVRETTINAIEAGATKIEFGVEWQAVATKGVYRRMIADNGKGMSPEEIGRASCRGRVSIYVDDVALTEDT